MKLDFNGGPLVIPGVEGAGSMMGPLLTERATKVRAIPRAL